MSKNTNQSNSNQHSNQPTPKQIEQLKQYAQNLANDQPMPYHVANEEVKGAIQNMGNPPNYSQDDIDKALSLSGLGPDNATEW